MEKLVDTDLRVNKLRVNLRTLTLRLILKVYLRKDKLTLKAFVDYENVSEMLTEIYSSKF